MRKLNQNIKSYLLKGYTYYYLPYGRHYKPRLVYVLPSFTSFFTAVYIVEWLNSIVDNLCSKQFLSLKSTVYNQEWFQIKSGL